MDEPLKISKTKIAVSCLLIPVISFYLFYQWLETLTTNPEMLTAGNAIMRYGVMFATTIACNAPTLWIIGLILAIGIIGYALFKRTLITYSLLNIALLGIFILPVVLATTGTSRFCMSFLG